VDEGVRARSLRRAQHVVAGDPGDGDVDHLGILSLDS
jgi:hypothetical protein